MSDTDDTPIRPAGRRAAGWPTDAKADSQEPFFPAEFGLEPPDETGGPLPESTRLRAADMQLVHALLLHLNGEEPALRQTRIERAIRAIRQTPQPATERGVARATFAGRPSRPLRRLVQWAVAASILFVTAGWLYLSSSNTAVAALEQVVRAIDHPVDRTYEISVEPTDNPPPEDRRSGLDGAVLYARGGNQFVLYRSTLSGNFVISGSNGRDNWLVRPNGSVLVSGDPNNFRPPMPENLATIPFVDIRLSLTNLRRGYQIEELPAERLDNDDSLQWRVLRAVKIDSATKGPKGVSIWFHPTTHLLGRVRFDQIHLQGRPEPRRMTISLISQQPLPANWFDHDAHHAPSTPVEPAAP